MKTMFVFIDQQKTKHKSLRMTVDPHHFPVIPATFHAVTLIKCGGGWGGGQVSSSPFPILFFCLL